MKRLSSISLHLAAGWALVIITLGLIGFWVPPREETIGESYLILFFHVPSAVSCMILYVLAGCLSLCYLLRRAPLCDFLAASAVEVGMLGCTITLVTGSVWARAAWGTWWEASDPRLTTVAVMWLMYMGYLALRTSVDEPGKRASFSAVYALLATLNVPLVHFAISLFGRVRHHDQVTMAQGEMVFTRRFGILAFLVLYTAIWRLRCRAHRLRHETRALEEDFLKSGI